MGRGYEKKKDPLAFVGATIYCWSTCRLAHKSGHGKCGGHCFNDFAVRLKVRRKKKQTERGDSPEEMGNFKSTKASGRISFFLRVIRGLLCRFFWKCARTLR